MPVRQKAPRPTNNQKSLRKRTVPVPNLAVLTDSHTVRLSFPPGGQPDFASFPRNNAGVIAYGDLIQYVKGVTTHNPTDIEMAPDPDFNRMDVTFSAVVSATQGVIWLPALDGGDSHAPVKGINGAVSVPVKLTIQ